MKKILIVEDDTTMQKLLTDKFTKSGFEVLSALNGKEGLKMALKEKPDMILLDLVMPVMDGMTMLSKLREDKWGKNARVIILSNLSDAEKVSEAIQKGTYDYLVKVDWRLEDIVKKISKQLGV